MSCTSLWYLTSQVVRGSYNSLNCLSSRSISTSGTNMTSTLLTISPECLLSFSSHKRVYQSQESDEEPSILLDHELTSIILVYLAKKDLLLFSSTSKLHRLILNELTLTILRAGMGVVRYSLGTFNIMNITSQIFLRAVKVLSLREPAITRVLVPPSAIVAPCYTDIPHLNQLYGDELIQVLRQWPVAGPCAELEVHPRDVNTLVSDRIREGREVILQLILKLDDSAVLSNLCSITSWYSSGYCDNYNIASNVSLMNRCITMGAVKCFWTIAMRRASLHNIANWLIRVADNHNFSSIVEGTVCLRQLDNAGDTRFTELLQGVNDFNVLDGLFVTQSAIRTNIIDACKDAYRASSHPNIELLLQALKS